MEHRGPVRALLFLAAVLVAIGLLGLTGIVVGPAGDWGAFLSGRGGARPRASALARSSATIATDFVGRSGLLRRDILETRRVERARNG